MHHLCGECRVAWHLELSHFPPLFASLPYFSPVGAPLCLRFWGRDNSRSDPRRRRLMECGLEIRAKVWSRAVPTGVEDRSRVSREKPCGLWVTNRGLVVSGLGWPGETQTCLVWLASGPGHLDTRFLLPGGSVRRVSLSESPSPHLIIKSRKEGERLGRETDIVDRGGAARLPVPEPPAPPAVRSSFLVQPQPSDPSGLWADVPWSGEILTVQWWRPPLPQPVLVRERTEPSLDVGNQPSWAARVQEVKGVPSLQCAGLRGTYLLRQV